MTRAARWTWLSLAPILAGCSAAPPTTQRGATPVAAPATARVVTSSSGRVAAVPAPPTPARADEIQRIPVADCPRDARARVEIELTQIDKRARDLGPTDSIAELTQSIERVWQHPCLAILNRFFPPPQARDAAAMRDVFERGLGEAMHASNGGLRVIDGDRLFVVPPEVVPDVPAAARSAVAPWTCAASDATCARTGSYVARAERAFEAAYREESARHPDNGCRHTDAAEEQSPFEVWALCALASLPETVRYPKMTLRPPTTGWLTLRGRRGHYEFADEVRSYDLATGAAYVVSSKSALVLAGPSVDLDGTDRKRVSETQRGEVAVDQARELAFVLLTKDLPLRYRERIEMIRVPTPVGFSLHAGTTKRLDWAPFTWRSSAQTTLAFSLGDGKRTIAAGHVTWPGASDRVEDHADDLIRTMEAGLVEGCPIARPPVFLGGGTGAVSPLDASPGRQVDVIGELDRRLQKLAATPCTHR